VKKLSAFLVFGALAMTSALHAQTYAVYEYTALLAGDTTIANGGSSVEFAALTPVRGEFRVDLSVPDSSTWVYPGEVGVYTDAVTAMSFVIGSYEFVGNGLGEFAVNNNRRLYSTGGAFEDAVSASLTADAGSTFETTTLGGGIESMNFTVSTGLVNPAPSATTSISAPTTLDVADFTQSHTFTVTFGDTSTLVADLQSVSYSLSSEPSIVVPEASHSALAMGGLALVLGLLRRRRRQ